MAGPAPRYGTWVISTLAMVLNSSPVRCAVEPTPCEAKLILPGCFLASSISSLTLFAGTDGLTISTIGVCANSAIGTKSRLGSNGSPLVNSVGLVTSGPGAVNSSV